MLTIASRGSGFCWRALRRVLGVGVQANRAVLFGADSPGAYQDDVRHGAHGHERGPVGLPSERPAAPVDLHHAVK